MKISLWHQFSSNHSASFTVLGRFETVEKAQEVETIFKTLLEAIQEAQGFDIKAYKEGFLSWPEHEAGQKYDIKWEQSLDWIGNELSEHIIRFERNVFVTTALLDTWQSSQPVLDLMKHFSQEVYLTGEMIDQVLLTSVECHVPNEQTGRDIVDETRLYLVHETVESDIPPWEMYSAGLNLPYSVTDQSQGMYREIMKGPYSQKVSSEVFQRVMQTLYEYQRARMEKRPAKTLFKNAIRELLSLEGEGYTFASSLDEDDLQLVLKRIGAVADTSASGGKIERTGSVILIPEIAFLNTHYGLPAIIDYLKNKGCSSITYAFFSVPYASRPEYM